MANGITTKGMTRMLEATFRKLWAGGSTPADYYLALCTDANTPDEDTNTLSDLTEVTAANGYTSGGEAISDDATGFDYLLENDTDNKGQIQIKDITWTATGGTIPDIRWAVLLDDNATPANREVIAWWDLTSNRTILENDSLTLQDLGLTIKKDD